MIRILKRVEQMFLVDKNKDYVSQEPYLENQKS